MSSLAAPVRRVGVIGNPASHAYRRLAASSLGGHASMAEPNDAQALQATLAEYAQDGVDLLVVHGGDGTLQHVLTALPSVFAGRPPDLALLPAGNTNLAALAVGSAAPDEVGFSRLMAAAWQGRLQRRTCPVLEVAWPGQPARTPVRGLLFGAAAFTEAKRIADAEIHRRGLHRRHAVGLTLALTALRTLAGRGALQEGTRMSVALDGGFSLAKPHFLVLATTLDRLTLGLWPFWGDGAGAVRWLDIDAPPPRLGAALLAVLTRRPRPWMAQAGYRSGRAASLHLDWTGAFVLDGEFFEAETGIVLSSPGSVTFVRP